MKRELDKIKQIYTKSGIGSSFQFIEVINKLEEQEYHKKEKK